MTLPAIVQNNLAVAHLRARHVSSAVLLCLSALEEHRRTADDYVKSSSENFSSSGTDADNTIDQCMLSMDPVDEQVSTEPANAFIYRTGIAIPTTETDPAIITPIIIFNTALAHHLLAEHDRVHSLKYLQKAKELYELTGKALGTDRNLLFEFVILNNIAMIYREVGDESAAKKYLEYLLSIWMVFVDRGCDSQMRQLRGFLLNLHLGIEGAAMAA